MATKKIEILLRNLSDVQYNDLIDFMNKNQIKFRTKIVEQLESKLCGFFIPSNGTETSATKCAYCGREKWEH